MWMIIHLASQQPFTILSQAEQTLKWFGSSLQALTSPYFSVTYPLPTALFLVRCYPQAKLRHAFLKPRNVSVHSDEAPAIGVLLEGTLLGSLGLRDMYSREGTPNSLKVYMFLIHGCFSQ